MPDLDRLARISVSVELVTVTVYDQNLGCLFRAQLPRIYLLTYHDNKSIRCTGFGTRY